MPQKVRTKFEKAAFRRDCLAWYRRRLATHGLKFNEFNFHLFLTEARHRNQNGYNFNSSVHTSWYLNYSLTRDIPS